MTDTHVDVQIISFICFVWVSPGNQQLEDTYVDGKPQIVICLICFMKVLTEKKTTERLFMLSPKRRHRNCDSRDAKQLILVSNDKDLK